MTYLIGGSLLFAFVVMAYLSVGRASASTAREKGRRPALWGVLGTFLPIALIVVLMLPPADGAAEGGASR